YASRPSSVLVAPGSVQVVGETAYGTPTRPPNQDPATLYSNRSGKTVLSINWNPATTEKPTVRKGSWVLDASVEGVGSPSTNGWAHGFFYRVVGLSDTGASSMDLELQTPLREDVDTVAQPSAFDNYTFGTAVVPRLRTGRIFVMDNVAEVFE